MVVDAPAIWNLALSAIAAATGLVSVSLWFIDRRRQRQEAPQPDIHLAAEPFHNGPRISGRKVVKVVVTNAGDAAARHFRLDLSGDAQLLHHHEDAKIAALHPGGELRLPVSLPIASDVEPEIRLTWVQGPGKKLEVKSNRIRWQRNLREEDPFAGT